MSQTSAPYQAQDIILSSLRLIGVLDKGEPPTSDEMSDCLQALNFLVDNWSARSLLQQASTTQSFVLTAFQQSYTIGATGQMVTSAPPVKIISAYFTDSSNIKYPIDVVTQTMFDSYQDTQIVSARPAQLFYDPPSTQSSSQLGTIKIYYTPDASSTYTLWMNMQIPFTEFTSLTSAWTFPPSYLRAFKYNLAIEVAPEFQAVVSKEIIDIADESLETLEAVNATQLIAGLDLPGRKGASYNWISDEVN